MFKVGDSLTLANKPRDMDNDWEIVACYYRGPAPRHPDRGISCLILVKIDDGTYLEALGWTVDLTECKPTLNVVNNKSNFRFGRQREKIQAGG